ncbi:MAG: glycoside hydrolase family 73 protein [Bombilactobacillus mellifer]|nr:glycoside hydrolase family 73 protein [Bombilactobacillus mellifer]
MKKIKKLFFLFTSLAVLLILSFLIFIYIKFFINTSSKNQNIENAESRSFQQEKKEKQNFINQLVPIAQQIQKEYHILASISISQACLESDWGRSKLASKYHNYFGIKGSSGQNTVMLETMEFISGKWIKKKENFVVYNSLQESMIDHAKLLSQGTSWNNQQYQEVIDADNYQKATQALVNAGYATDPSYAEKLIRIIRQYQLNRFDY